MAQMPKAIYDAFRKFSYKKNGTRFPKCNNYDNINSFDKREFTKISLPSTATVVGMSWSCTRGLSIAKVMFCLNDSTSNKTNIDRNNFKINYN